MTLWHGELIRAPWASLSLSVGKVSAFFATKSLDEYLYLQQLALMEIGRVVTECGCKLAYPTNSIDVSAATPHPPHVTVPLRALFGV